jgi:hypothetical protein
MSRTKDGKGIGNPPNPIKGYRGGENTLYSEKMADEICEAVRMNSRGLEWICAQNPHFPSNRIIKAWLYEDRHPYFTQQYIQSKKLQAHTIADKVLEVAFNAVECKRGLVELPKLQIDALKWTAARLHPSKYNDKYIDKQQEKKETEELTEEQIKNKLNGILDNVSNRINGRKNDKS